MTVGVVDSGCDATHPDLADRVEHNVTLLSPEYVNAGTDPIIAIPIGSTPYNNTDLGSGHGTHVGRDHRRGRHVGTGHRSASLRTRSWPASPSVR